QAEGLVVDVLVGPGRVLLGPGALLEPALQPAQQVAAALHPVHAGHAADLARRDGVLRRLTRLADRQGPVLPGQGPRPDAAAAADRDERRQLALALAVVPGDLRPDVRLLDERVNGQSGHHDARPAGVVALGAFHRPDDGRVLHLRADLRQQPVDL